MLVKKYDTVNQKFANQNKFIVGLTCLIIQVKYMNYQIIDIKYWHPQKNQKILPKEVMLCCLFSKIYIENITGCDMEQITGCDLEQIYISGNISY